MRRLLCLAALLLLPAAGWAQAAPRPPRPSRSLLFGIAYVDAKARGPLAASLGNARGAGGFLALPIRRPNWLAIRLDLSLLAPDEDIARFPLEIEGQTADVSINTTSNLASAAIGPQFSTRIGPVRPYAFGNVGVTRFIYDLFATADVGGETRSVVLTTGSSRLSGQAGVGVRVPLVRGGGSVQLDAGLIFQRTGAVEVPVRGTLGVDSTGALTATTTRARLDFRLLRAGITVVF